VKNSNNKDMLLLLANADWYIPDDLVQGLWNSFEKKLIEIVNSCNYESRRKYLPEYYPTS
jgi:hypothetical protein